MDQPYKCLPCWSSFSTQTLLAQHRRSDAHFDRTNAGQSESSACGLRKFHQLEKECAGKLPVGVYLEMQRLHGTPKRSKGQSQAQSQK